MATRRLSTIVLAICCFAVGAIGMQLARRPASQQPTPAAAEDLIRITPQRIPMAARIATLCYRPPGGFGPHGDVAEVHIYANPVALEYRRSHPNEHEYPIGSKFVKEKYSGKGDENPQVATIMERRSARGDVSDWRFAIVSLPGKIELPMAGQPNCAECHQAYNNTGYVSGQSEFALKTFLKIE